MNRAVWGLLKVTRAIWCSERIRWICGLRGGPWGCSRIGMVGWGRTSRHRSFVQTIYSLRGRGESHRDLCVGHISINISNICYQARIWEIQPSRGWGFERGFPRHHLRYPDLTLFTKMSRLTLYSIQ